MTKLLAVAVLAVAGFSLFLTNRYSLPNPVDTWLPIGAIVIVAIYVIRGGK